MRSELLQNHRPDQGRSRNSAATLATLFIAIGALLLGSCSTGPGGIENGGKLDVKYYHMNPNEKIETVDPMIAFERQHHMHGAISATDQQSRFGHYYAVRWKVDDRTGPVTVKFEYRQEKTGLETKALEQSYDVVKRSNRSEFTVVGEDYFTNGEVTSFKVSLLRNGEILATSESFAWKD